jgi:hypothetical protein
VVTVRRLGKNAHYALTNDTYYQIFELIKKV